MPRDLEARAEKKDHDDVTIHDMALNAARAKAPDITDIDSLNMSKGQSIDDVHFLKTWVWLFVFFALACTVGIIVIIVIATEETTADVPDDIDIVIYQRPASLADTSRQARYVYQARSVARLVKWRRNTYILLESGPDTPTRDEELDATLIKFSGTQAEAFQYMVNIPGIAEQAIFLGDQTFPLTNVKKQYMFYGSVPRMFNIFRDQSEVNFFAQYIEETMPTLVTDLDKLREAPGTWSSLVFREVTEEHVVLRQDMNRDVFIASSMVSNAQAQLALLTSSKPLFVTFHVGTADTNAAAANAMITSFLDVTFPPE